MNGETNSSHQIRSDVLQSMLFESKGCRTPMVSLTPVVEEENEDEGENFNNNNNNNQNCKQRSSNQPAAILIKTVSCKMIRRRRPRSRRRRLRHRSRPNRVLHRRLLLSSTRILITGSMYSLKSLEVVRTAPMTFSYYQTTP